MKTLVTAIQKGGQGKIEAVVSGHGGGLENKHFRLVETGEKTLEKPWKPPNNRLNSPKSGGFLRPFGQLRRKKW